MIEKTTAMGYTREYESFGHGDPGYWFKITRDSDGVVMRSGPGTNPEHDGFRNPDWQKMPIEERRRIVKALREGKKVN